MEKKNYFAQHCTLYNDSSTTLKAFFLQSQIPYKSIPHCPWRSSLVQHLDFVLVFKKKTTSGRAVLSWLALLSTICTSREGFFLSCFLCFLFVLQSKFWGFSLFSTAPNAWGVSLNTTFDWINFFFSSGLLFAAAAAYTSTTTTTSRCLPTQSTEDGVSTPGLDRTDIQHQMGLVCQWQRLSTNRSSRAKHWFCCLFPIPSVSDSGSRSHWWLVHLPEHF